MRALFVSLLFLLPAIGLGRSIAPVENGVAHYKKMRRAYFEVKGETQLDLCYTQFKKQRKYSAKRLNVLMDNGGKTHWDRYHKAHGSLPKFMRQCLDEVEGRVKSKCLNVPGTRESADRPQAGTAASAQRKSRIFKNFNCNSNKIKKLAAIEKEARVLGQLIARYEKHANLNNATALETFDPSVDLDDTGSGPGEAGGSDDRVSETCLCPAVFNPVCGVDGETYSNSCQASCASVDVRSEGMCEAGGDGGVADGSCVCTQEYAPVCGANGKTYSNQCHARCDSIDVISEGACAGTAESVDETAEIRSTIEGLEGKIISANSDLANCLSSAIERVPASGSDSIDARKDFANQQCANYRGNYKSLVERKKALEGKLAERTSESSDN